MTARSDEHLLVDKRGQLIGTWATFKMFFLNSSYNCPELKLYGYANDLGLKAAIKKALVKDWKYQVANGDTRLGWEDWLLHMMEDRRMDAEK